MTALQVTALTDFLLACVAFFCAGVLAARPAGRWSAAWYWRIAMACLAVAALLGGIDHGFIEPAGLPRAPVQRATWAVLGVMTAAVLLTLGAQFLGARARRWLVRLAALQALGYAVAMVVADSYLVVVVNYLPVILALLAFNLHGLGRGTGSRATAAGIGLLLLASTVQALRLGSIGPLDHNGLYHLISMPGVALLCLGARRLRTQA